MFRKVLVVAVVCAALGLAPATAMAQGSDDRQFEAFGSFSYLIGDVGNRFGPEDFNSAGFQGAFAVYLNDWLGIGGEVGYHSGELDLPVIQVFPTPEVGFSQWTVMFGPRFRLGGTERLRVGAQALVGIARGTVEVEIDVEALIQSLQGFGLRRELALLELGLNELTVAPTDTAFGAAFGVSFDLDVTDELVWRVVQPDILLTNYGSDTQAHFRIASGLGYRF